MKPTFRGPSRPPSSGIPSSKRRFHTNSWRGWWPEKTSLNDQESNQNILYKKKKYSCARDMNMIKKVLQSETWSQGAGVHHWFKWKGNLLYEMMMITSVAANNLHACIFIPLLTTTFATASRMTLETIQPIQWAPGALFLGLKRPGCEAHHSIPSTAEVEEWVGLYFHSHNTLSVKISTGKTLPLASLTTSSRISATWLLTTSTVTAGYHCTCSKIQDACRFPTIVKSSDSDQHVWNGLYQYLRVL
jgi:hypothetical protein